MISSNPSLADLAMTFRHLLNLAQLSQLLRETEGTEHRPDRNQRRLIGPCWGVGGVCSESRHSQANPF